IGEKLAASDPGNADWQRDLSVSYERLGNVQVALDDGAGALDSYRKSLAIREKLVASHPGNAGWQRDLTVIYDKIGDVQVVLGDGAGALASYRESLAIVEKLAASYPSNAQFQRDLAVSYVKIAERGDIPRENYGKALAILKGLKAGGRLDPADEKYIGQ